MSNQSHTPGPWRVGPSCRSVRPKSGENGSFIVCELPELARDNYGNAHLIAAAPELLEVARLVIEAGKNRSDRDWEAMHFDISEALEIALPAYTKATGEQS